MTVFNNTRTEKASILIHPDHVNVSACKQSPGLFCYFVVRFAQPHCIPTVPQPHPLPSFWPASAPGPFLRLGQLNPHGQLPTTAVFNPNLYGFRLQSSLHASPNRTRTPHIRCRCLEPTAPGLGWGFFSFFCCPFFCWMDFRFASAPAAPVSAACAVSTSFCTSFRHCRFHFPQPAV